MSYTRFISMVDVAGFSIMTKSDYAPTREEMLKAKADYPEIRLFDIIDNKIVPHAEDESNFFLVETDEVAGQIGVGVWNPETQEIESIGKPVNVYQQKRVKKELNWN